MFFIPDAIALYLMEEGKGSNRWVRLKLCVRYFFLINLSVYFLSYIRGVKTIAFLSMTHSYCVKWLTAGIVFAFCYTVGIQYARIYFHKAGKVVRCIFVLLVQSVILASLIKGFCCKQYQYMDITDRMQPAKHTYLDEDRTWCMNREEYEKNDVILSGPYMNLAEGAYTITIEYDSSAVQYAQVKSEKCQENLEAETSFFLGGGQKQTRKTCIRSIGKIDDLDIQIKYSGKGDIRIRHIWIQQNNAVGVEYVLILLLMFIAWDIWKYLYAVRRIQFPSENALRTVSYSFLSTLAISFSGKVVQSGTLIGLIRGESNGVGIIYLLLWFAIYSFYRKHMTKECDHMSRLLACVLTICMIIGISMSSNENLRFILDNPRQSCICIGIIVGYYILFKYGIRYLFVKLDSLSYYKCDRRVYRQSFLIALGVLSVCWLAVWICFLPGSIAWDGMRQLNMALENESFTNHHPWLSTMWMKFFLKSGLKINDNMGVLFVVLSNEMIELIIYAFTCYKIGKIGGSKLYFVSLLFYGLHPVFSMFGQLVMKDGLYAAMFTLFMIKYIDCVMEGRRKVVISKPSLVILAVTAILTCVLRKNGIYIVLPAYFCLLADKSTKERKLAVIMLGFTIAGSFILVDRILPEKLGIEQGSSREMLSIPFQQTARCFKEHEKEITDYEFEIIDNILAADRLGELYDPGISDPVKNTYKEKNSTEDLKEYFRVWIDMFFKYPVTYIEATLQGSYGYFYPFANFRGKQNDYISINYNMMTGDFDPHYYFSYEVRNKIGEYIYAWKKLPILSLFMSTGSYTWVVFIAMGYTVHRKRCGDLIVYIAPLLNVLVCMASPVNGEIRYVLPLMAATPLLLCWCCLHTTTCK